jgi:hypothetical protein
LPSKKLQIRLAGIGILCEQTTFVKKFESTYSSAILFINEKQQKAKKQKIL